MSVLIQCNDRSRPNYETKMKLPSYDDAPCWPNCIAVLVEPDQDCPPTETEAVATAEEKLG